MNQPLYDRDFEPPTEKDFAATSACAEPRPTSSLALASCVSGLLGWTLVPIVGAIAAVVTGHAALRQIRDSGGRTKGVNLALAGLVFGYLQGLILAGIGIVAASLFWWHAALGPMIAAETMTPAMPLTPAPAPATAVAPAPAVRGVKRINEMDRADFQLIAAAGAEAERGEVVAFYDAGKGADNPEFALVTTRAVVYVRDGSKTTFDLKDVAEIKDDAAFETAYHVRNNPATGHTWPDADFQVYNVEVAQKGGNRIRVRIDPAKDGASFFEGLKAAWTASRGQGP